MPAYSIDWGVVGHQWAIEHLGKALAYDRLRHAYLISGVSGVGKTVLAKGFARAINCTADGVRPCGECRACRLIESDSHSDVSIIKAHERALKIDQIRELQHTLALRPVEAPYRVIIIENLSDARGEAQDALLKTLEEPPPYVILLITAENLNTVLPTIRSRCQPINLRPLPIALVKAELERRSLDPDQAILLAQLSNGRLGWALKAASDPASLVARDSALSALEGLIAADRVTRFQFAEQVAKKDSLPDMLGYWLSYWRDVVIAHTAAHLLITNRDHQHAIDQLGAALHLDEVSAVIKAIQRTQKYIHQNANARLTLEVLMIDMPRHKLLAAPLGA